LEGADEKPTIGPWSETSKDITEIVENLAHAVVQDFHKGRRPQLGNLSRAQFRDFVKALGSYQNFIRASDDGTRSASREEARTLLFALANQDVRCSLVYSYLGSIFSFEGKNAEAITHLEKANRINPADQFALTNLPRLQRVSRPADQAS